MEVDFKRLVLTEELIENWLPTLERHFKEVNQHGIDFNPQTEKYLALEKFGGVATFAIYEKETDNLMGYNLFLVHKHPHNGLKTAHQDMIYVVPKYRGIGPKLIRWSDKALKIEGVDIVYYNLKIKDGLTNRLKSFGYNPIETVYAKKL